MVCDGLFEVVTARAAWYDKSPMTVHTQSCTGLWPSLPFASRDSLIAGWKKLGEGCGIVRSNNAGSKVLLNLMTRFPKQQSLRYGSLDSYISCGAGPGCELLL